MKGDTFSGRRGRTAVRAEYARLSELIKGSHHGNQFQMMIGAKYALNWMLEYGSAPSKIVRSLSENDTAQSLAEQHAELLRTIDWFMQDKGKQLFGGSR
jgi:lysyl-tRNA synthetase class I